MPDPSTRITFITITQALRHPLFTVLKREETPGIFQLRCGEIPTVITIEIKKIEGRPGYSLDASHGIKTPDTTLYFVRYREYASPGAALRDYLRVLARTYHNAVSKGHRPSTTWLIPDQGSAHFRAAGADDEPTGSAAVGHTRRRPKVPKLQRTHIPLRSPALSQGPSPRTVAKSLPQHPRSPALGITPTVVVSDSAVIPERDGPVTSPETAALDQTASKAKRVRRMKPKSR